jgi:putative endonuclease
MNYKDYYVYILMNKRKTVNYTGVTNDIIRRVYEHKNKLIKGFTSTYNIDMLVYYEDYNDINIALNREKEIKGWKKSKKLELIQKTNPEFKDLYPEISR